MDSAATASVAAREAFPAANQRLSAAVAPLSAAGAAEAELAPPNPSLRLDPSLGVVVLEFRDARGEVAATMPTQRQLAAYREAAPAPLSGAAPAGMPAA